MEAIDCISF